MVDGKPSAWQRHSAAEAGRGRGAEAHSSRSSPGEALHAGAHSEARTHRCGAILAAAVVGAVAHNIWSGPTGFRATDEVGSLSSRAGRLTLRQPRARLNPLSLGGAWSRSKRGHRSTTQTEVRVLIENCDGRSGQSPAHGLEVHTCNGWLVTERRRPRCLSKACDAFFRCQPGCR